jgi:alpha-ketoglutarate-dependent taurine dioxygenase
MRQVRKVTTIRTSFPDSGAQLPLILELRAGSRDLSELAAANRSWIEEKLLLHGAILFRHFDVRCQEEFERFVATVCSHLLDYVEGATPRIRLGDRVYTSTEFPPTHRIMPHNELSYVKNWPTRIWFCCLEPAEQGGETPICDVRKVHRRIPAAIVDRFASTGWMLMRNFGNGLSLPWRKAFGVSNSTELETYCRGADVQWQWLDNDRLRTRQVRPATIRHPQTGEWLWFNHIAFWHISSLPQSLRESMLEVFPEDELPYNTYYGDGSSIEEEQIRAINVAYEQELVTFPWVQGDVLMLDNMMVAHGRAQYRGFRKVIVSMGDPRVC